jgi:hypothetical protein
MTTFNTLKTFKQMMALNNGDFDFIDLPLDDDDEITIWNKEGRFILEFNGKFIKSAKTVSPILNTLEKLMGEK